MAMSNYQLVSYKDPNEADGQIDVKDPDQSLYFPFNALYNIFVCRHVPIRVVSRVKFSHGPTSMRSPRTYSAALFSTVSIRLWWWQSPGIWRCPIRSRSSSTRQVNPSAIITRRQPITSRSRASRRAFASTDPSLSRDVNELRKSFVILFEATSTIGARFVANNGRTNRIQNQYFLKDLVVHLIQPFGFLFRQNELNVPNEVICKGVFVFSLIAYIQKNALFEIPKMKNSNEYHSAGLSELILNIFCFSIRYFYHKAYRLQNRKFTIFWNRIISFDLLILNESNEYKIKYFIWYLELSTILVQTSRLLSIQRKLSTSRCSKNKVGKGSTKFKKVLEDLMRWKKILTISRRSEEMIEWSSRIS